MNSPSYVYVLVYPHLQAVKIGKADNVFNRIQRLCHWGDFDADKSFKIEVDKNNSYKLESSVHFLLSSFKKEMVFGDGFTEFFEIECYSKIIELMNLLEFKMKKINIIDNNVDKKYLSGSAFKLRKFENKISQYSDSLKVSASNILGLKRAIRIIKKRDYSIICYSRSDEPHDLVINAYSQALNYRPFIFGTFKLGEVSSLTGSIGSSFIKPISHNNQFFIEIDINDFFSFGYNAFQIGRKDYIQALIFCYDFLKKGLANESELPTIKINNDNRL